MVVVVVEEEEEKQEEEREEEREEKEEEEGQKEIMFSLCLMLLMPWESVRILCLDATLTGWV